MAADPDNADTYTVTCLNRVGEPTAVVEAPRGTVLLRVLEQVGFVYGSCGGFGSCGGCAVELGDGRLVQACYVRLESDLVVKRR